MISQIKQKGFTIVELLIVIVVIAILAAISMPRRYPNKVPMKHAAPRKPSIACRPESSV